MKNVKIGDFSRPSHVLWCEIQCRFWFCHQTLAETMIWLSSGRSKSKHVLKSPDCRNITCWNVRKTCQNWLFFNVSQWTRVQNSMENLILLSNVTRIYDLAALQTVKVKKRIKHKFCGGIEGTQTIRLFSTVETLKFAAGASKIGSILIT